MRTLEEIAVTDGHNGHGNHGGKDDPIKKYYDLSKKVENALRTTDHYHRRAYAAGEESLKDKGGQLDFDKLKTQEGQFEFVNKMGDTYINAAKEYFKVGKDVKGDDLYNEQLMNAYAHTTKGQLLELVRRHKDSFSYEQFDAYKKQFMEALGHVLGPIPSSHLTDEHKAAIIKHMGLEDRVDVSKIGRSEAIKLLGKYRHNKAATKPDINADIPDYALKKKDDRSDYVENYAAAGGHH